MIRPFTTADRSEYLSLSREFYDSDAVLHPIPESYRERTFEETMNSDRYLGGFLLTHEGRTAGYALTSKSFSPEAGGTILWLEEIYLRPAYRSLGLGREFFAYLFAQPGVARLRLEAEPDNSRAIALYERLGFRRLDYLQFVRDRG